MKYRRTLDIITLLCFLMSITSNAEASTDSFLLTYYDYKVNKTEQTCVIGNHANLPEDRRTFAGRECMCDGDCVEYKDCCRDSRYYRANQQSPPFNYHCLEPADVYVKAKCAPNWPDPQIAKQCETSTKPIQDTDFSSKLPISNVNSRITYGNSYCAICNHEQNMQDWKPWNMMVECGEAPPGYLKKPIALTQDPNANYGHSSSSFDDGLTRGAFDVQMNTIEQSAGGNYGGHRRVFGPGFTLDINLYIYNDSLYAGYNSERLSLPIKLEVSIPQENIHQQYTYPERIRRSGFSEDPSSSSSAIDFNKYQHLSKEIAMNAKYDSRNKQFVSRYDNKDFVCKFSTTPPEDAALYTRKCVPNVITECPAKYKQDVLNEECLTHTQVVYNEKAKKIYRNKDCARCQGEKDEKVKANPKNRPRSGFGDDAAMKSSGSGGDASNVANKGQFTNSRR